MKNRIKQIIHMPGFTSVMASIASIGIGLIFGFILLLLIKSGDSINGLSNLLFTGASSTEKLAKVLYQAAPLIMTGLSVGFAFKTGLFNIGAAGQYMMGTFFALYSAIVLQYPWWAALMAAMVGGAIWGAIPGLCKAFFNVNEVITSIMFNWIGLFAVNLWMLNLPAIQARDMSDRTANLAATNPGGIIPKWGLDTLFDSPYMNISILITVIVAIIVYVVLNKTTFGYELKACGLNRNASIYAGINAKRNIVLSMVIAGALAGLGGGIYYLSGTAQYAIEKILPSMGFNGIPVALLATSHPIGTILSALFISYIQVGGEAMQPEFAKEVVDIIIAVIIYLSAFALLMKGLIARILNWKRKKNSEKNSEGVAE